jgi:hypothetical protein
MLGLQRGRHLALLDPTRARRQPVDGERAFSAAQ